MTKTHVKSPDKTREALIEAASFLFAKKGYDGTSVKDIADRAKVNISLVSYHFGGKELLYKACLEPFVEEKLKFFERNILRPASKEDFRFRLKLFIEEVLNSDLSQPETGCIIHRDVEMGDPIVLEIFKKTIAKLFEQFISFIQSAQDEGYIRDDMDASTVCLLFMGEFSTLSVLTTYEKNFTASVSKKKNIENNWSTRLSKYFFTEWNLSKGQNLANLKNYFLLFIFLVSVDSFAQTKISMDTYLDQVKTKDPAYKASQEILQGAHMRSAESDLLVLPVLGAEFNRREDKSPLQPAGLYGTDRSANTYLLYISEQTQFGLNAKLAYGENYTSTQGQDLAGLVPPGATYFTDYYTASPSISLTQSLWRNGFGSETRAQELSLQAKALEIYYNNRNKNITVLIDAQTAYYRLYYAKQTVAAVKSSLNVANQLLSWAKNRLNKGLGETSDFLQTKAAFELRQLDLSSAEEEVRSASRAYNSLREIDSDVVNEDLQDPGMPDYKGVVPFSDKKWRDDVRASEKNLQSARATALLGKEKNKPTLDLTGSYALNSLDQGAAQARNDSFRGTYPTWAVGVKFSTPLAFGKASDVREGYEKEAYGADQDFRRKTEEQFRDYNDLQSKVANAYARLTLSKTLEQSQKSKSEEERKRHQRGRTTFFEVLQFEQDYLTSELSRIKTESELSGYLLQLQKYREE